MTNTAGTLRSPTYGSLNVKSQASMAICPGSLSTMGQRRMDLFGNESSKMTIHFFEGYPQCTKNYSQQEAFVKPCFSNTGGLGICREATLLTEDKQGQKDKSGKCQFMRARPLPTPK